MSKTPLQARQLSQLPARNLIINGNFDFWQRGISFAAIANTNYSTDRFRYVKSGTMVHTVSRSTDVPTTLQSKFTSSYSLLATVTTAQGSIGSGDQVGFEYFVEGNDYVSIHSASARLQFWVKSSVTGLYSVAFRNSSINRSYVSTYTIDQANTWEKKTIDLTFDTTGTWLFDNGRGLIIDFNIASGSGSNTAVLNQWQTGNFSGATGQVNGVATLGNIFQLAQVSLYPGDFSGISFDIPFQRAGRTIQDELAMCQRYYWRPSFDDTTTSGINYAILQCIAANNAIGPIVFPVSMRTSPTFSRVGGVVTNATNGGVALTNLTLDISTPQLGRINALTGGSLVAGNSTLIQRNAVTDFIDFSAEL